MHQRLSSSETVKLILRIHFLPLKILIPYLIATLAFSRSAFRKRASNSPSETSKKRIRDDTIYHLIDSESVAL